MKITVGIPMHNAASSVTYAIGRVRSACKMLGADYVIYVMDDFSDEKEAQVVRQYVYEDRKRIMCLSVARQFPHIKTNPNLGTILNACLDQVAQDTDYYLNVESDVYLLDSTLPELIKAIERTGAPAACPLQFTPDFENVDFVFWGMGVMPEAAMPAALRGPQRPKWCNLGCLLVRGDVARDRRVRSDAEQFDLFCVDGDYTSCMSQVYGRPVYWPDAKVVHKGRQSTKEGQPGGFVAHEAVTRFDTKWAEYIKGGIFA